jgi:hypothetical protein
MRPVLVWCVVHFVRRWNIWPSLCGGSRVRSESVGCKSYFSLSVSLLWSGIRRTRSGVLVYRRWFDIRGKIFEPYSTPQTIFQCKKSVLDGNATVLLLW